MSEIETVFYCQCDVDMHRTCDSFIVNYTTLEFSLNGTELSLNSVNSGNSENLRNH